MSLEKTFLGAVIALGAAIALFEPPRAGTSSSVDTGEQVHVSGRAAAPAGSLRMAADFEQRPSTSGCSMEPVSHWSEDTVAALARCMTAAAPLQYRDGSLLVGARSEGRTLILDVTRAQLPDSYVVDLEPGADALCQNGVARELTAKGVSVRLDLAGPDGSRLTSLEVSDCP